jgi:Bacterial protein of unknown function (DUF899)
VTSSWVREKAHTRDGDALAAARRRLPMVELDGTVKVTGPDGPVPFLNLFQDRDELMVYQHMRGVEAPVGTSRRCEVPRPAAHRHGRIPGPLRAPGSLRFDREACYHARQAGDLDPRAAALRSGCWACVRHCFRC